MAGNGAGKSRGLDVTQVVPEQVNSLVHGKQPYTTSGSQDRLSQGHFVYFV